MDSRNQDSDGLIDFEHFGSTQSQQSAGLNPALEKLRSQNAVAEEFARLTGECKNEDDLLFLRNKISSTEYTNLNKDTLLEEVDKYVAEKLASATREAALLGKYKEDLKNAYLGAVGIVVIGMVLTIFFPIAFPIAVVIAILGLIGNMKDGRRNCQASEAALNKVEKFKKAGYPL